MADAMAHAANTVFDIVVNNKQVPVSAHSMTGLQIKQAAINARVQIGLDFQLAELEGKKRKIIGDADAVNVHQGLQFVATAPDDNS